MLFWRLTKNEKPVESSEISDQESIFKYGLRFIQQWKLRHPQVERESNRCLKKSGDKNKA